MISELSLSPPLVPRDAVEAVCAWAEAMGGALVLVNPSGRCLWANGNGRRLLSASSVLQLRGDLLIFADPDKPNKLGGMLESLAATGRASQVFHSAHNEEVLVVHGAWIGAQRPPFAALFLSDPRNIVRRHLPNLGLAIGLTPAEHAVVESLLEGASPEDIARAEANSLATVRTHIKRAYKKLGVTTRAELSAKLEPYLG